MQRIITHVMLSDQSEKRNSKKESLKLYKMIRNMIL